MPVYEITGPDGKTYEVNAPDGASQDDVLSYAKQHFGGQPQTPENTTSAQPELSTADKIRSFLAGLHQSLYDLPQGAASLVARGTDAVGLTDHAQQKLADVLKQYNEIGNPEAFNGSTASKVGRFEGNVLTTVPLGALGALKGGAVTGALLTDPAASNSELAGNTVLSGLGGKAVEAVAPSLAKLMFGEVKGSVPSLDQLKNTADAAYKTVDASGMQISPNALGNLVNDVQTTLTGLGHHPALQPKTAAVLGEMGNFVDTAQQNGGSSLQNLDVLRRIAGHAANSTDPSDKMMGRVIKDKIDDFVENLGPNDVVGNVDQNALDALNTARDAWARYSKGSTLQGLVDKAQQNSSTFSQSGYENALRNQFRKLANNDRGMARFSPDEQDAITQVATGGPWYSAANTLRQIGKMAPVGAIPLLAETGGVAAGGPAALAIPLAGLAGRYGATKLTESAANKAIDLAKMGGVLPSAIPTANARIAQQAMQSSAVPLSSLIPLLTAQPAP